MNALIFAAGRGERMRPLTDTTPKPLLEVDGKPLIVRHLKKLAAIGVRDVVINTSHLAEQFPDALGDGARWGLRIHYVFEGAEPLETGGGMLHALPLLGDAPFIAISGDVVTDFDLAALPAATHGLAHLVLVNNPPHHPDGDFLLDSQGHITTEPTSTTQNLTFAGIGIFRPQLLDDWRTIIGATPNAALDPPRFRLAPLLHAAASRDQLTGQHHQGAWTDVGTPERLAAIQSSARHR